MNTKKGFTLIEILVVIAILGLLITVGVTSYTNTLRQSRDAKRKTDLEQIRLALELYKSDNGSYPVGTLNQDQSLISRLTSPVAYLNANSYPKDPQSSASNSKSSPGKSYYYLRQTSSTFVLCAALETIDAGAQSSCPVSGVSCSTGFDIAIPCNYGITQP